MIDMKIEGIAFSAGNWPPDPTKPTLLFIHGSGEDRILWHRQVDALAEVANTVAMDLPGHGRSDGPAAADVAAYTETVAKFISAAQLPRPIPCGLSIGGAIAQHLLIEYPDRVAAGVLINTGARLRVMPAIFETIEKDYAGFVGMLEQIGASPKTDAAVLEPLTRVTAACPPSVTAGDFHACDNFDVMARLCEIRHPVLVISAADDTLTPPKYGDFLEKQIAGARRAHILDAGHLAPVEQPEAVNAAISSFLADIVDGLGKINGTSGSAQAMGR
ncbi:MAG: alpha/beta fold hydrolase [Desulfobacterales bacterium]|nr:alpha/beta fold hydrolase [Desulfobacterales bacterium]